MLGINYLKILKIKLDLKFLIRIISSKKILLTIFISTILIIIFYFSFNLDWKFNAIYQKLFSQILGGTLDYSNADRVYRLNICRGFLKDFNFLNLIFGRGLGWISNNNFSCVNFWFNQLIDIGLLGISLYLSIIIFFIWEFINLRKKIKNNKFINFNFIISSYFFVVIQLFFQTNFYMPIIWLPFLVGMILLKNKKLLLPSNNIF